ncbi:glycoside hydrolase family 130 protein [Sphingobium nicotianae]|uniref:glycoside hydrolase family 130 protein n=1 Tax=Sphingobium nicotianae TaxID=2782607 RepID=UPI003D7D584F
MPIFRRLEQRLTADPARVVVRPFHLSWQAAGLATSRAGRLVSDILDMNDAAVDRALEAVFHDFEARHWQIARVFETRFEQVATDLKVDCALISGAKRLLIGAYFCHEYSYAAAALMNPSIVPHPDQSGLDAETVRFVMSLRAVGEGHISSISFREGLVSASGRFDLVREPPIATAAMAQPGGGDSDGVVIVNRDHDSTLSGTVIFPVTPAQANGLEDLRLTAFTHDDGEKEWIGTYTAYSGQAIHSELMRTHDFRRFSLQPMAGSAAVNKGMALFPRKVDGRYMMIGRQDGKNLFLLGSDEMCEWSGGARIMEPKYPWEFIQIGNCGPPIELDEGWLLLTHGVGPMRKYALGAALLDKNDPSIVLARTPDPLLSAADHEREGYVPNVVYTCGALRLGKTLFLPYGLADSSVAFAFADISDVLAKME